MAIQPIGKLIKRETSRSLCTIGQPLEQRVKDLKARYSEPDQFDVVFNSDTGSKLLKQVHKAYFSDTPTFAIYAETFGLEQLALWVRTQLLGLDLFSETKEGAESESLEEASKLFAYNYEWVKITEFLLFIARFKLGYYGKFYGYFDPITIGEAFRLFLKERVIEISRIEQQISARKRAEQRLVLPKGYTSYSLYQELKERAKKGDKQALKQLNTPI